MLLKDLLTSKLFLDFLIVFIKKNVIENNYI